MHRPENCKSIPTFIDRFCKRARRPSVARSGQNSLAQGLPWVISPTRTSPEGATRYGRESAPNLLIGSRALLAHSGQNVYFRLPRVNPGLSFLAPAGRTLRAIWPTLNTY